MAIDNQEKNQRKFTIDIRHTHCGYCGEMLLSGEGGGDFTVEPREVACNNNHMRKYKKAKDPRAVWP
jgi:hypothetical protein